ncbi:S8 family peptidase [Butyrivibrio proteoclasticus]|uniref:S8 family peptidase n=1 Tax=Butyrivibrio proteoclasticus TaxID=43305 RepID=UPI000685F322|nr:S8 family serine peptidase [Butyrivibrio proteoclasticus]
MKVLYGAKRHFVINVLFSICFIWGVFNFFSYTVRADEVYEEYAFFAGSYEEAAQIAGSYGGELVSFMNNVAQIRMAKSSKEGAFLLSSNSGEGRTDVVLYPDLTYSYDIPEETEYTNEQWYMDAVGARSAFDVSKGAGVKVAIIDSGIDVSHEDLQGAIVDSVTTIPESAYDEDGYFKPEYKGVQDNTGHGTHVAGIIGARENSIGITGLAPECSIVSIKAAELRGDRSVGRTSYMVAALNYAKDCGARVVNISLGGSNIHDEMLEKTLNDLREQGIIVVCSAGNINGGPTIMYPAAYDSTITVSAVKKSGNTIMFASSYSNYGSFIDISAPGSGIISTYPGGYKSLTGTSMASPIVAAAVADLIAADPSLSSSDIKRMLFESATDMGDPGRDDKYGYGVVNFEKLFSPYSGQEEIDVPAADLPTNSLITKGLSVCFKTSNVGGSILYTLDGKDPDENSDVVPANGISFTEAGFITVKARTRTVSGQLGDVAEFLYEVIDEIRDVDAVEDLLNQRIADRAANDPVLKIPAIRYHALVQKGMQLEVKLNTESENLCAYIFDRAGEDAISVGETVGNKLIYKNLREYDCDIWVTVTSRDQSWREEFAISFSQVPIKEEPETGKDRKGENESAPENENSQENTEYHQTDKLENYQSGTETVAEDTLVQKGVEAGLSDEKSSTEEMTGSDEKNCVIKDTEHQTKYAKANEADEITDPVRTISFKEYIEPEDYPELEISAQEVDDGSSILIWCIVLLTAGVGTAVTLLNIIINRRRKK